MKKIIKVVFTKIPLETTYLINTYVKNIYMYVMCQK